MKIIHCADLHIDSKMQTNLTSDKASTRKKELVLTFERLVDYADKNGVSVIIIAGDMFDTSRVSAKSRDRIFDIIKNHAGIDFLYLAGNHDEENIISQVDDDFDNLKIFNDEWTTFNYDEVKITGIKLNSKVQTTYDMLNLNKDDFNIVVLHGQISKYNLKDNSEKINLTKLKNKNIDYLALGHIHSYEKEQLDKRGVYCYAGCMEGRGFDECGEKGFVLLDIEDKKLNVQFVPFAKRTLFEVEIDITGKNDWFDIERKVLDEVADINKDNLLKIVLKGKYKLSLDKQIEHLSVKLNDRSFFAKIKDESSLEINAKDFEKDLSLKGEFIREVLNSTLSDSEKEGVILIGLKALEGEEI